MNSKVTSYILAALLVGALAYAFYQQSEAAKHEAKYEEALIDAQKSEQRIENMKEELEKALKDSETHRKQAEQALTELQKAKKK
jgi:Flp pilus assembly protein TadB